jgi:hypothetical protein
MKILIDSRVVKVYSYLPETFKLRELMTKAVIPLKDEKTIYDSLVRMQELGILHKKTAKQGKEARKWVKEHSTLNEWFNEYITTIENQPQTRLTITAAEKRD